MAKENREHKDSVFVDLFYKDESAKKNLLDLHNALYDTFYTDPEQIRLIGLEDVLFRNFKNDVAFSVEEREIVLEKCRVLKEYSLFVETTRKYEHTKDQLEQAVKECIKNGILRDYLLKKGNEVINMLMAEYSYETDIEVQREEAAEEANKRAEEAEKKAEEISRKLENANRETAEANKRADKIFIDLIEKTAKNLQLSVKDTCNRLGQSYDDYLKIKKTL